MRAASLRLRIDPDIEEPLGEYAAAGQIVMVCFKGIKCLVKALGKAVESLLFPLREGQTG